MKRTDNEVGGFKVLGITKANFQHDWFSVGQGFAINVNRKDNGPTKPDTYVASTPDGSVTAEGSDEAEAANNLRDQMQSAAIKGEL